MKFMKWKILIITSLVCLLPIFLGIALWSKLPDEIAIHFNIYGQPDNYVSKSFAVFGLPVLMVLLQSVCCFANDINAKKHGERTKFERATKWIIPILTVVLQIVTLAYAIGMSMDIRRIACFIVGVLFLVVGNYLPKFDYVKHYDVSTEKARKINRFIGYETVIMGVLMLASIFFPPVASIVCLCLLIPYVVIGVVYGIVVGRGK